jgi:hypothetical protein
MFSIPNPIPKPPSNTLGSSIRNSPTATEIFPTHLAITTLEASRVRGDWGLKRSLPAKSTSKTSTPAIRVRQIDTIEHVTDFRSSSDHTLTLEKFQEMGIAISMPDDQRRSSLYLSSGKSVFEADTDFTDVPKGKEGESDYKRWKFSGPWLAGLTDGEFIQFIKKKVRNRRPEFREFSKKKLAAEMTKTASRSALDDGEQAPMAVEAKNITDEQLTEYFRRLRYDRVTLYALVSEFLDLAPLTPPKSVEYQSRIDIQGRELKPTNPYAKDGPPVTHPSAGLTYLRTSSYVDNHPVYGPQSSHPPVLSRIVQPRSGPRAAVIGVGGIITEPPLGDTQFNQRSYRGKREGVIPGIASFELEAYGGAKAYVQPMSAKVSSSGKLLLTVSEANAEAELAKKEQHGAGRIYEDQAVPSPAEEAMARVVKQKVASAPAETKVLSSSKNYGLDP